MSPLEKLSGCSLKVRWYSQTYALLTNIEVPISGIPSTQTGLEVIERLLFLASLPLAANGQREGGGFSCINKRIISHPVT